MKTKTVNTENKSCFELSRETAADWFNTLVHTACAYYGKSEFDFWQEVKQLEEDMERDAKFKGDPNKMAPKDYIQYHDFRHEDNNDGDVSIVAEIICVHTFNNEILDVFHPLYDDGLKVTSALITHTEAGAPTLYTHIEATSFRKLVDEWITTLHPSCREEVTRIVDEGYAFLQYLE